MTSQTWALTSCHGETKRREHREHTVLISVLGVVPDFLLCCWMLGCTGGKRCTHVHTYCTCTSSHMKESAPKVERVAKGGGCGQADISSWVFATAPKCHIIQPHTSIKVRRSFQTEDGEGIITSLHHPKTICFSPQLPFYVFVFYTDMSKCSKMLFIISVFTSLGQQNSTDV